MTRSQLTSPRLPAHRGPMAQGIRAGRGAIWAMVVLGCGLAGGCITVSAPEEPIVIELNINIKQEVIYRLAADAGNTIEQNPGIF